jgi:hypothetical protein
LESGRYDGGIGGGWWCLRLLFGHRHAPATERYAYGPPPPSLPLSPTRRRAEATLRPGSRVR